MSSPSSSPTSPRFSSGTKRSAVLGGGIQKQRKKTRKPCKEVQVGHPEKSLMLQMSMDMLMGRVVNKAAPCVLDRRERPSGQLAPVFHAGEIQAKATGPHVSLKPDRRSNPMVFGACLSQQSGPNLDATKVQDMDICYEKPSPAAAKGLNQKRRGTELQYDTWRNIFPKLVKPLLVYTSSTQGVAIKPSGNLENICQSSHCLLRTQKVLCLYLDHCCTISVAFCRCTTAAEQLVANGLFPSAPQVPNLAFSIGLLEFYRALFEQSCDAIASMAAALYSFYHRRGFPITSARGARLQDPFRRGFTVAVQWYDALRVHIENEVDHSINSKYLGSELEGPRKCRYPDNEGPSSVSREAELKLQAPEGLHLTPGRAARLLRDRCPACFGHTHWGRLLNNGGDVHVSLDGNFHHRHQASAGDGPKVIDPTWLLSKAQVDEVGCRIEEARNRKPKEYGRKVPDVAIDGCKASYEAADGDKKKASSEKFDDHGLMFLVCRHDIPLFFANIDTAGEQQKYAIALLLHLLSFLPAEATASVLYDIACILDRSLQLHDILPESVLRRLQFATSVMHAYGHQWACQLNYNPRMRVGMGLSDGEGVERLWSRLRKLIGVERSQWRSKRLWLIDNQASAIARDLKNGLGLWLGRRSQRGVIEQGNGADNALHTCKVPVDQLEKEWVDQVAAQSSLEAHAPARLKQEVEKVLSLHDDLDAVESTITKIKAEMSKRKESAASEPSIGLIDELIAGRASLTKKVEELYSSLNLPDSIPQLKDVNLEFVQTLILARDLKINIRKRAIGTFFEWARLDQASGGRGQALGTKLHQQTRNAISKRTPALVASVRKFNTYCTRLEDLQKSKNEKIPIPLPLPLNLAELREDPSLMQDVWITPLEGTKSRWLVDAQVRAGIHAMLKKRRCEEESVRLEVEARNLVAWYEHELRAMEGALRDPAYVHLRSLLLQRYDEHLQLPSTWGSTILPRRHFAQQDPSVLSQLPQVDSLQKVQLSVDELDVTEQQLEDEMDALQLNPLDPGEAMLSDIIHDDCETEDVEDISPEQISFSPEPPVALKEDLNPLDWEAPEKLSNLVFPRKVKFSASDLERLQNPKALLNDVCINDGASLLQAILSASPTHGSAANRCAILSTWDLPAVRRGHSDDTLWRNTRKLLFWKRDVWILPIHQPNKGHWVCCAIYPKQRRIDLFDSLGGQCEDDIRDAVTLAMRMYRLANEKGETTDKSAINGSWTTQRLVSNRLQHNEYDCGVWTLAFIISLLRGYDIPKVSESVIPILREQLCRTITRVIKPPVPVSQSK